MSEHFDDDAQGARVLSNSAVLAFLWRQWRRRPWLFAALVGFTLVATAVDVFIPVAAGQLIDTMTGGSDGGHWAAFAVFLGLAITFHAMRQIAVRFEIRFSSANMADMTTESFAKVQRFALDWHANTFAGSVVRKITRGMWAYDTITSTLWFGLIPSVLVMVGLSAYMLFTWPLVGVYALVVTAIFMVASVAMSAFYVRPQNLRSNRIDSELGGAVADAVSGIATVKSFGAEAREDQRFHTLAWRWRREVKKTWLRFVNTWLVQIVAVLALQAGLTGLLINLWQRGEASPGAVVFAITAFMLMAGYMRRFGEEVQNVQRGLDEIQDIAAYAQMSEQIADIPGAPDFIPGEGRIAFDGVRFTYAGQNQPLYEDFSLTVEAGEKVALVGPTGSGKSTFVKLVQRLYDIDAGAIRIDGQDVREVTQASLRRAIALVPQDPALFHRTIAENIAYARPDASSAEIVEAAKRARAHDFIMRLPGGYDTLVGERGVKLSGGERQRVAIARAVLADAPILIFDEATSSLDNETEREVQEAMADVMAGRTAIIIAHRLSTIRDADRILVFDQGRVVEQGTHRELSGQGDGLYARLAALAAAE
ncbi:MAG: ABC transporter ATP-binding protein [Oceanicaulis sp.]|uniref:ABC transporter ATP-binding protein n=1 Tax=Glycocaulis sp. TaxID=1969725 RepID=UPI0025B8226B|nr:ABC transporter ATP-binding protein [Glycocaulis sp.]MCC5980778.1 ABC transporter ATP-binding protein [Oceanicaulis sp.]MCH8521022.1 ABC transporter ATP-binding protein/permease [Glycocaulis sp.]